MQALNDTLGLLTDPLGLLTDTLGLLTDTLGLLPHSGQTGTGKTYTIMGGQDGAGGWEHPENMGLVPRAVRDLFHAAKRRQEADGVHIVVVVSFMEIYNERLHDLLQPYKACATRWVGRRETGRQTGGEQTAGWASRRAGLQAGGWFRQGGGRAGGQAGRQAGRQAGGCPNARHGVPIVPAAK